MRCGAIFAILGSPVCDCECFNFVVVDGYCNVVTIYVYIYNFGGGGGARTCLGCVPCKALW
jgi:hypothetical protein